MNDPCAKSLLDFISIEESGGNYNAFIGHADATGTFDAMTIAQVYDFQRQLIEDGEPSSAVGRYQFLQRTLNGLVQQMGLSPLQAFTPSLQDDLGLELLYNRQYRAWIAGAISDEQFAHNLSCEWASLPDPYNGGKSHYDGVGPNHAGQTLEAVYSALAQARALQGGSGLPAAPSPPSPPAPPTQS